MKKQKFKVARLVLGVITVTVLFVAIITHCSHKTFTRYDQFEKKAEISGSWSMVENYDRKISDLSERIGFKIDSIIQFEGNEDTLKNEINILQLKINEYHNAIGDLKVSIKKDSVIYKSMIVKK